MTGIDHFLDPRRLWIGEAPYDGPLALIDLDVCHEWPDEIALPPCPVIGLGDPTHPLGEQLDAVIEPPITAAALVEQVVAQPAAASVVAELLRALPGMSVEQGLFAESLAYGVLQGGEGHARWIARREPTAFAEPGHLLVHRDGVVLTLTLDRLASENAIDRVLRDALYEAFSTAAIDPTIATVRLRARGRSFSLGADLAEFGTTRDPPTAHAIRRLTLPARMIVRCADRLEVYVDGACVGSGLEMAAFAHRITASERAWFQLPELAMGILPGAGGCVSLTRRIGRQRTALMILSGRRISARAALGWGLVDALVDNTEMDDIASEDGGANVAG